jgi:hypothetical protein
MLHSLKTTVGAVETALMFEPLTTSTTLNMQPQTKDLCHGHRGHVVAKCNLVDHRDPGEICSWVVRRTEEAGRSIAVAYVAIGGKNSLSWTSALLIGSQGRGSKQKFSQGMIEVVIGQRQ